MTYFSGRNVVGEIAMSGAKVLSKHFENKAKKLTAGVKSEAAAKRDAERAEDKEFARKLKTEVAHKKADAEIARADRAARATNRRRNVAQKTRLENERAAALNNHQFPAAVEGGRMDTMHTVAQDNSQD